MGNHKKTVVTFGEIMLRLNPQGYERFLQADEFAAAYAGAEANVCVALSNLGASSRFVTKLPKHEIGQAAVNSLRRYGVDTSAIVRGGERVGIYFVEKGASQRPSKVIYDRAHSSIACAEASEFDWDSIFEGADWFHFTGITPALSDTLPSICLDALKAAKAKGICVSCDLNYRSKLWSREKAGQVMSELAPYIDVCIANEEDAADVFGIRAADTEIHAGKLSREGYRSVAEQLVTRFGFKMVAITLRESISASDNHWSAMLYDGEDCYFSRVYPVHLVDRVGGGDSFGGGLIYALHEGKPHAEALEFAVATSALKQAIEGDFAILSCDEVERLAGGNSSGRVVR